MSDAQRYAALAGLRAALGNLNAAASAYYAAFGDFPLLSFKGRLLDFPVADDIALTFAPLIATDPDLASLLEATGAGP